MTKMGMNLPRMWEIRVQSLGQEDPLEKEMATTPVVLPGEFHGQRSLVGYSPRKNLHSCLPTLYLLPKNSSAPFRRVLFNQAIFQFTFSMHF